MKEEVTFVSHPGSITWQRSFFGSLLELPLQFTDRFFIEYFREVVPYSVVHTYITTTQLYSHTQCGRDPHTATFVELQSCAAIHGRGTITKYHKNGRRALSRNRQL